MVTVARRPRCDAQNLLEASGILSMNCLRPWRIGALEVGSKLIRGFLAVSGVGGLLFGTFKVWAGVLYIILGCSVLSRELESPFLRTQRQELGRSAVASSPNE